MEKCKGRLHRQQRALNSRSKFYRLGENMLDKSMPNSENKGLQDRWDHARSKRQQQNSEH